MTPTLLTDIQKKLTADSQAFVDAVSSLSEAQLHKHMVEKWSVADVMQHLYLSARPVVRLIAGPREVLSQWGKAETPSKSYDDIESTYLRIVATGVKAPASMTPRPEDTQVDKQVMLDRFTGIYQALVDAMTEWSDQELDVYRIPHPALGKLTVREMLHFTSIHTLYHLERLPAV